MPASWYFPEASAPVVLFLLLCNKSSLCCLYVLFKLPRNRLSLSCYHPISVSPWFHTIAPHLQSRHNTAKKSSRRCLWCFDVWLKWEMCHVIETQWYSCNLNLMCDGTYLQADWNYEWMRLQLLHCSQASNDINMSDLVVSIILHVLVSPINSLYYKKLSAAAESWLHAFLHLLLTLVLHYAEGYQCNLLSQSCLYKHFSSLKTKRYQAIQAAIDVCSDRTFVQVTGYGVICLADSCYLDFSELTKCLHVTAWQLVGSM